MARRQLTFEREYPWEAERGSALERALDVHAEAQRVYAQQKELLPALQLERAPDPETAARVRDVGRRTRILREHEALGRYGRKPGDSPQKKRYQSPTRRVVPSRFPEEGDVGDAADDGASDPDLLDGRIETMLMDQEWDTRGWTRPKVHAAIDTLYSEIEGGSDPSRRELATTMLVRLLEVHEDAVDFVETTIPTLSNKAFRTLAKTADNQRTFRVATLLGVLSQWFARVLSAENAVGKSVGCLLRETELCARIVQHHWRGVSFERSLRRREFDPSVRARIRSMHLVKFVELRHQFKMFREVVGRGGLPADAVQAYVTVVYRLVQNRPDDVDGPRSTAASSLDAAPSYALANQQKLISSGALAFLASLMTATQRPAIAAMVISIVRETASGQGPEKVMDVLQCNIVERVQAEMKRLLRRLELDSNSSSDEAMLYAALDLTHVLCDQVLAGLRLFDRSNSQPSSLSPTRSMGSGSAEDAFVLGKLTRLAAKFLASNDTIEGLFQVLHESCLPQRQRETRCTKVLVILRLMACYSFGFPQVLDLLTRNGGRHLELVLQCLLDSRYGVVSEALALYCEVTDHPHGRQGLTTAGAVRTFMRWCQSSSDAAEGRDQHVMGLVGCALIARQTSRQDKVVQSWLVPAVQTSSGRLDALYKLLLDLVATESDGGSGSSHAAEQSAVYFHRTSALPTLVKFLTQVTPTCMEPATQSPRHRNISCIVLSRFLRVPQVARACFSEDLINHLALSLQCNRLDEIEKVVARCSADARLIHQLGSKEACKALTRLARCSSSGSTCGSSTGGVGDGAVVARLRPSITSSQVPELPQAMVCDVMFRLHVVEDLVAYIKPVDFSADAPKVESALTAAAVELAGHLRPLPYGEAARVKFFKMLGTHEHGKYADDKLMLLVEVAAPSILRVLKEPSLHVDLVDACCAALSRLACTNAACSALLVQGCLHTALMHMPEFLYDPQRDTASSKNKSITSEWVIDSTADEHGLLGVPAALYTLLGKLCAVAEGRTAIMRAQVLPRILKRLQLYDRSSGSDDIQCKSEIAVVISRLAMVNAVEGNTSELFVHFGVLELLMRLLTAHHPHESGKRQETTTGTDSSSSNDGGDRSSSHSPSENKSRQLRVVDHVLGAIAALSQDLLVCVPKLVELGVLRLLSPLLDVDRPGDSSQPRSARADMIQLHAVQIIHSIAVRRIGYDFAAEMRGREAAVAVGSKTVGDLARETLAAMNERKTSSQRVERPPLAISSSLQHPTLDPNALPSRFSGRRSTSCPQTDDVNSVMSSSAAFPALCSPVSSSAHSDQRPRKHSSRERSADPLPVAASVGSNAALSPSANVGSSCPVVKIHPASPVKLNGVDLATTRPPGKKDSQSQQQPGLSVAGASPAASSSPRYIFATPKPKKRSSVRDAAISSLMLDPLFDSNPPSPALPSHEQRRQRRLRHQHEEQQQHAGGAMGSESEGYSFVQETDRFGHYVQVKGRRARRGDRYVPSLGLIAADAAPVITYRS